MMVRNKLCKLELDLCVGIVVGDVEYNNLQPIGSSYVVAFAEGSKNDIVRLIDLFLLWLAKLFCTCVCCVI